MTKQTLTFSETMSGPFALGVTDTAEGVRLGQQNNTSLAMHAQVGIDDLDRFIRDPEHLGSLRGSIDFAPFGIGIQAPSGVFNLFKPTNDPDLTYMVYELAFQHQGQDYYLAGHKEVKDDRGSICGPTRPRCTPPCTRARTSRAGSSAPACSRWASGSSPCCYRRSPCPTPLSPGNSRPLRSSPAFSRAAYGPATSCRNSANRAFLYAWNRRMTAASR